MKRKQGISHPQSYKKKKSRIRQDFSNSKLSTVYRLNISVSGLSGHSHVKRDLAFRVTDIAVSGLVLSYILLESLV